MSADPRLDPDTTIRASTDAGFGDPRAPAARDIPRAVSRRGDDRPDADSRQRLLPRYRCRVGERWHSRLTIGVDAHGRASRGTS
jgi:hypothetical protein